MENLIGKKVSYPMYSRENGTTIREEGIIEKQWEAGIKTLVQFKDSIIVVSADICKVIE